MMTTVAKVAKLTQHLVALANRYSGKLLIVGLGILVLHNLKLWRTDKALLARRSEPDPLQTPDTWHELPKVSVLVAAWNEAEHIQQHIDSFLSLRYPHKELILCAGGTDSTFELAKSVDHSQVTVLRQQAGEGKQRALARILPISTGSVIFLTDADCFLDDQTFERTVAPLVRGECVTTGSRKPMRSELDRPFVTYQWYYHVYGAAQQPAYVSGLEGRNTALWRDVLLQSGGFDNDVPVGTDYFLANEIIKHGYRIAFIADSEIETAHPRTYSEYLRQQSRWQRNMILHGINFGQWSAVAQYAIRGVLGFLALCLPMAALFGGKAFLALWFLLTTHAFASRIRYMEYAAAARSSEGAQLPSYAALFLYTLVDFVAWTRGWIDAAMRRRRWTW